MIPTAAPKTQGLGFLTIVHDINGYTGAYLVTNLWSRPIEFRVSTAVQPSRMQQLLYGGTLQSYVYADLIGKTLVEKATIAAGCIFTDCEPALDLRLHVDVPVLCLPFESAEPAPTVRANQELRCHPKFPKDEAAVRELLDRLDGNVDLTEPFARIREAMGETRKLGPGSRN